MVFQGLPPTILGIGLVLLKVKVNIKVNPLFDWRLIDNGYSLFQ